MTSAEVPRNGVWPVTITQSVTPIEYRSERMSTPTPANCSGLANSGVPANAPGDEMPASEADLSTVFARPRSMILAATVPPLFQHHHDVCWLDIPVDQIPFVNRAQSSSQLRRDSEVE